MSRYPSSDDVPSSAAWVLRFVLAAAAVAGLILATELCP